MSIEILIVLLLIVVNGLLATSEMAVVSSRPARLKARGDRGAQAALALAEEPGRFLSAVQTGITLVGVLSGAFSGATLGAWLAVALPAIGVPSKPADELGLDPMVVAITYLSLIAGELVSKQIVLAGPEATAARVAPAMRMLSRVARSLVWLLNGRAGSCWGCSASRAGARRPSATRRSARGSPRPRAPA